MSSSPPVLVNRAIVMPDGGKLMWTDLADGVKDVEVSRWRESGRLWEAEALQAEAAKTWKRWEAAAQRHSVVAGETELVWQTNRTTGNFTEEEAALREQLQAIGYLN
jgi:hypothetical protein